MNLHTAPTPDHGDNSPLFKLSRRRRCGRAPRPAESSAPVPARRRAGRSRSSGRGVSSGRSRASRRHASIRSSRGHITESMPSRLTPRSRNGITVAGRSLPPARPQAATLARYLSWVRIVAKVVPPTASIAPAQRSLSSGRAGLAGERGAIDRFGGAEAVQIIAAFGPAGRGDDPVAEPRQQRDRDAADPARGAGHQHLAGAGRQPVPLERHDRQHRGEPGGADRHRLRRVSPSGRRTS